MATERPAPDSLTRGEWLERTRGSANNWSAQSGPTVTSSASETACSADTTDCKTNATRRAGPGSARRRSRSRSDKAPDVHPDAARAPGMDAGYGRRGQRRPPSRIDEHDDAALPMACPDCGGAVGATQVQEEIPAERPVVRAFRVQVGSCRACGRRVQGRHPLQTSDALGAAGTHLGPHVTTLVV